MINLIKTKIGKISSLVLVLSGMLLISSCTYWHSVNLKYIIPEGYEGMIMIAWNQKNGTPKIMEGDYEVYTIPASGFLRSQVKDRSLSPIDEKFYSYNKQTGERKELEIIDPSTSLDTIKKENQIYRVGLFTASHGESGHTIFFLTRDKKSKFMDAIFREKYVSQHEDALYEKN